MVEVVARERQLQKQSPREAREGRDWGLELGSDTSSSYARGEQLTEEELPINVKL